MKIYIASQYIKNSELNKKLKNKLSELGIEVFLPKEINVDAITPEEKKYVGDICYEQVASSDIIIGVYYFGVSVAAEIGSAITQKRAGIPKKIVILCLDPSEMQKIRSEVMVDPYVDLYFESVEDLLHHFKYNEQLE